MHLSIPLDDWQQIALTELARIQEMPPEALAKRMLAERLYESTAARRLIDALDETGGLASDGDSIEHRLRRLFEG